jgi:Putative Ig domain
MKNRPIQNGLFVASLAFAVMFAGCGGGGNRASQSSSSGPPPLALTITTNSNLPGTLTNSSYSVALQAVNGTGALTWSIAPISNTALFVNGLSIDPSTGVVSGTANFSGTAGFTATVKDSASHIATKSFTITGSDPLQSPPPPQLFQVGQFQQIVPLSVPYSGGVQPLTYTLTGGSLPRGLRFDFSASAGQITGSAIVIGSYPVTITIQDSYSPPEVVAAQITIQVIPPALFIADSVPRQILLNRPFSGKVIADGGIPPYKFSMTSGSLPPGLSAIDPSGGQFSGSPTTLGSSFFSVNVTDSSSPALSASINFSINVVTPLGRNDTVATATPIGNGMITASISPYIDPPATPVPGDNDYYKLVSLSGNTVHVETFAQRAWSVNPLDTVIEIVDGNGVRLITCRQPGNTSTNFTSTCVNDDITDPPTTDSALDLQVPGAANTATTFYVHVLDWRGDARPDMNYQLQVSGLVAPMSIQTTSIAPAARGLSYSQQLSAANGIGTVTWSIPSGSLPPGLTLSSSGSITGAATTDGTYSFSVLATDSGTPPQTATVQESIQVVDPLQITSPAVWPDACLNQPYTFAIQTSGGLQPFFWSFVSNGLWVGINLNQSTGVFSGSAGVTGTFFGVVGVGDGTQHFVSQQVTLNVVPCG